MCNRKNCRICEQLRKLTFHQLMEKIERTDRSQYEEFYNHMLSVQDEKLPAEQALLAFSFPDMTVTEVMTLEYGSLLFEGLPDKTIDRWLKTTGIIHINLIANGPKHRVQRRAHAIVNPEPEEPIETELPRARKCRPQYVVPSVGRNSEQWRWQNSAESWNPSG